MSRTYRRKRWPAPGPWWADGWHRDWSCGNPACCGGEAGRIARRAQRAADAAELRRDPESAPTQRGMNRGQRY